MTQIIQAQNMSLGELKIYFHLHLVENEQFFEEWQENLPEITDWQKQLLDRIKAGYFNLIEKNHLLEKPINMAIVSPILFVGEFYLSPFSLKNEKSVEIAVPDEEIIVKGSIDTLVFKDQLWLTVIESKKASFSLEEGLPQILAYMLATPHPEKPCFGMITNGGSFMFIKLVKAEISQYATSNIFEIRNRGNDLYEVLRILKHLSELIV